MSKHVSDSWWVLVATWICHGLAAVVVGLVVHNTLVPPSPPDGDSMFFLPAAARYAAGEGLTNPLYETALAYHPSGDGRLIWHGFIAPLLWGGLAPTPDYQGVFRIMAIINLGSLVLVGAICLRLLKESGRGRLARAFFLLAAMLGMAAVLRGGRPESVALFWVAGAVWACVFLAPSWRDVLVGLCAGLLAVTSPVAAVLALPGYVVWLALRRDGVTGLSRTVLLNVAGGMAALGAAFWWYPYSLGEWLAGLAAHSHVVTDYEGARHWYYWMIGNPMRGVFVAAAWAMAGWAVWSTRDRRVRIWALAALLLELVLVWYFAPDARNYNVVPLLPLAVVVLARMEGVPRGRLFGCASLAISCLMATTSAFFILENLVIHGTSTGWRYEKARQRAEPWLEGNRVAVTSGLVTLLPPGYPVRILRPDTEWTELNQEYLLVQQINPWKRMPPNIEGYALIEDGFTDEYFAVAGRVVSRSPRGYNFAVYKRSDL